MHNNLLILQEICPPTLGDRVIDIYLKDVNKVIDGSSDASTILSLMIFQVPPPPHLICFIIFKILMLTTNYGLNNTI